MTNGLKKFGRMEESTRLIGLKIQLFPWDNIPCPCWWQILLLLFSKTIICYLLCTYMYQCFPPEGKCVFVCVCVWGGWWDYPRELEICENLGSNSCGRWAKNKLIADRLISLTSCWKHQKSTVWYVFVTFIRQYEMNHINFQFSFEVFQLCNHYLYF